MNHTFTITYIEYNDYFNITQFIKSPYKMITLSLLLFINLFIFASNLFMIIILLISKNKRFDATRKFLINLSIIDIQFALYIMPISIIYLILKMNWLSYYILCYLWIIIDIYFCTTNMFNLVIIAFDRMLAINYAVKYNQIMSPTRVRLLLLLIWLLALLIILPLIIYIIWYQWNISSNKKQNINLTNSLNLHYNDDLNDSIQYKLIINKRGISIGLLIDNNNDYYRQSKKKLTLSNDNLNKMDFNQTNNNNNIMDNNKRNNHCKMDKTLKNKSINNHSKYGLLRVHVGGKQLLCSNNTFINHKCNSTTNINSIHNNNNNNNGNISQHVKLINNDPNDSTVMINTLPDNSTIPNQDDSYDQLKSTTTTTTSSSTKGPQQQQHSSLTSNILMKSDYTLSNQKFNDSNSINLLKPMDKLETSNNNNNIIMKKHSNSLSEVNRNKLNDNNNNQSISQQLHSSSPLSSSQQQNFKEKLTNILRKHSFHTLSPYTYIKPLELSQSRRSTGRTDKHDKFNDIITLRRCALMPLNHNTPYSSMNNEYIIHSNRNSENLSNLSTTFITPRNSNQLDKSIIINDPLSHPATTTTTTSPPPPTSSSSNYHYNIKMKHFIELKAIFIFLCIAINPIIYGSASEDLRKAFKRFILHCGKIKHEKKALKRLVLAGLGAAGIPYGHRIIIPQQMKSTDFNNNQQYNRSVLFNKPLMVIADIEEKI
ncbi:unnamed protein product [Schistosoma margrebowiei]|uniref:G-protein coupled receptors family 1 profile domain-containing protein n=1 Tax=Schistosoma margrebowiei TaxID=48269 RepID=A0AA85A7S1_9TREM|nr:unnamed protein product [Schistosoma margrebowiei]